MMTENADGMEERQILQSERLGDVAPGQLPQGGRSEEPLMVTETEGDSIDHSAVTEARGNSLSTEEPSVDPEDRLFDSPPQSPRLPTSRSTSSNGRRYITEEESLPPTLREIRPLLNSQRPSVASAEEPNMDQTLRHLRLVVANTSQAETEAIIAEQAARLQFHNAHSNLERARENINNTRRVSQNAQRRIQEYEAANRVFGTREQIESQGSDYVSPISAMFANVERWSAEQGEPAVTIPGRSADAANRSHSHPSRRDESRTDESSSSGGHMSRAGGVHVNGSRFAGGLVAGAPNSSVRAHSWTRALNSVRPEAQENTNPLNDSLNGVRRPGVDRMAPTGNPRVLTNLTNMAANSGGHTFGPRSTNDNSTPRRQDLDGALSHMTEAQRVIHHPRPPTQEWAGNHAEPFGASFRPHPWSLAPGNPDGHNRWLEEPLNPDERNRWLEQLNVWHPQSSYLEPHSAYARINPFGSSGLSNASANPLMPRRPDYADRGRPNMLSPTSEQEVTIVKPPPKTKAEMTVEIECRICMEQLATVACLPCGTWDCF